VASKSRPTSQSSQPHSRQGSRQSTRSKWDVSESSKEIAISSLRNQQPSLHDGNDSEAHDDRGSLGDYASDGDYQYEEYPGHQELGYDSQHGEGEGYGEGSSYNYDEEETGGAAAVGNDYDAYFYGNQYDNGDSPQQGDGDGQYYDQDGNLIDPSRISSEQFSDRNESTLQSSDYLRNLAL
jgi:hypothetical protein